MTPKQELFLKRYLQCGDGREAALAAGYKERTAAAVASRLLRMPEIQAAAEAKKNNRIAGPEEILEYLTRIMRAEGGDIGVREQMRAAELLGKNASLFGPGDDVIGDGPVIFYNEGKLSGSFEKEDK